MTGLKSGSGDDLWDDENSDDADTVDESEDTAGRDGENNDDTSSAETTSGPGENSGGDGNERPYIVRRAIQDKPIQFERDERLTFFVHDDVAEEERTLVSELESELGRDVPKFDVREAVYRAALRNRDDVLEELLAMGYTRDEE